MLLEHWAGFSHSVRGGPVEDGREDGGVEGVVMVKMLGAGGVDSRGVHDDVIVGYDV